MKNKLKAIISVIAIFVAIMLVEVIASVVFLSICGESREWVRVVSRVGSIFFGIFLFLKYRPSFKYKLTFNSRCFYAILLGIIYHFIFYLLASYFTQEFIYEADISFTAIISALLIAPLFEETIYRGWMFGFLREKRVHLMLAFFVSNIFFTFIHWNNLADVNWGMLTNVFIFGSMLTFVYHKSENLTYPILVHFGTNLSAILFDAKPNIYNKLYVENPLGLFFLIILLIGIALILIYFISQERKIISLAKKHEQTGRQHRNTQQRSAGDTNSSPRL